MPDFLNLRSHADSDPIRNFRFLVKFTALDPSGGELATPAYGQSMHLGFMTVQGLAAQTEAIPYREGGFNTTAHQLPGQQAFSPVTLQKGVVLGSMGGWDWFKTLYDPAVATANGSGQSNNTGERVTNDFRYRVDIRVLKYPAPGNRNILQDAGNGSSLRGTETAATFTLLNAWPTNLAYSDLNAADNAVLVEQLTLVHEGLVPQAAPGGYTGFGDNGQYVVNTNA